MTGESEIENYRKRLRYRSWHRGMREMDLIMGRFADHHLPNFDQVQLDEYNAVLEHDDPELYSWISGRAPLPEVHDTPMMKLVFEFKYTG